MKTCNQRYESAVEEIARRLLRASSVRLEPIPTYPDSIVYRVEGGGEALIFKGHDPDGRDRDGIADEAIALQQARGAGVAVPDVVEVDTTASAFPSSYVVMTEARGVPLDALQPEEVRSFARSVGEALRLLHNVSDVSPRDSWIEVVFGGVPEAFGYLARLPAEVIDAERLQRAVDRASQRVDEPEQAVLLHGDLGELHVFVDPAEGRITSVIDFGEATAGLWLWDLLEFHRPLVPLILDGYGVARTEREEIDRLVVTYALLKAVPWAAKWHARGEPQVLAWLRRTVEMFEETCA